MPEIAKRWNAHVWWALLLAVGAVAINFAFFAYPPWQAALPWLSLLLAIAAVAVMFVGLRRAFASSQLYRGKALSILLSVVTLAISASSIFLFIKTRALPGSASAPQIGQRLPDFTLPDTSGQSVSLDSLFGSPTSESSSDAPRAVLLIFYRGYW